MKCVYMGVGGGGQHIGKERWCAGLILMDYDLLNVAFLNVTQSNISKHKIHLHYLLY